ncbi:MAG: 4-alpha-glucanotransferase, partial [Pedobacter sp.]
DMAGPTKLREDFKLAGMKVLQFAFGSDVASSVHAPHNFTKFNTVVYTGTHDNNTIKGWFLDEISDKERKRLELYLGQRVNVDSVSQNLMELALKSTAKIAILQLQDVIGLESSARINTPATVGNNWLWRLKKNELDNTHENWLRTRTNLYGRG